MLLFAASGRKNDLDTESHKIKSNYGAIIKSHWLTSYLFIFSPLNNLFRLLAFDNPEKLVKVV